MKVVFYQELMLIKILEINLDFCIFFVIKEEFSIELLIIIPCLLYKKRRYSFVDMKTVKLLSVPEGMIIVRVKKENEGGDEEDGSGNPSDYGYGRCGVIDKFDKWVVNLLDIEFELWKIDFYPVNFVLPLGDQVDLLGIEGIECNGGSNVVVELQEV